MTGIDSWRSLREACKHYGATSVTVPALVAAVRDEAAKDAGAKALDDAAEDLGAILTTYGQPRRADLGQFLRDRAAVLRAAPPTTSAVPDDLWQREHNTYRHEQDTP